MKSVNTKGVKRLGICFSILLTIISCSSHSSSDSSSETDHSETRLEYGSHSYKTSTDLTGVETDYTTDYASDNARDEEEKDYVDVGIEDGTHIATVDYYNPKTGTRSTYILDVKVEDGRVTEIDFPNGGYIDESRFYGGDIDNSGYGSVEDIDGRSYDIQIDD